MAQTYHTTVGSRRYRFSGLAELMAKATPPRSGDRLAGVMAESAEERVVAQMVLAELPLTTFLNDALIPYEQDEITRLIIDDHDAEAFAPLQHLTVGDFRNWLLSDHATSEALAAARPGITPEMAAAVSKLMRNQDLMLVAKKCQVTTAFRNTIGLPGRLSTRLQPNHPTDDVTGIAASILDGLLYGSGDAVIGINPATDNVAQSIKLMRLMDDVIQKYEIPTQSCVLTHVTNTLEAIEQGAPVDLVFQSIGGTEATNRSFGFDLSTLAEAEAAAQTLNRGTVGRNVMYFETGQGSSLSADAHHGLDQQTCEARAYAVARKFNPLLVNTVVGFIGPEYLYDGKEITRAGLEDHFCGKLLGVPMGCDVCYTNHANADQNDMDNLLTLLGVAGCNFVMGIPGSDDIMLNYQTTSFHDALYARRVLGLKAAPEFEQWLATSHSIVLTTSCPPPLPTACATCRRGATKMPKQPTQETTAPIVIENPWERLRAFTDARIGLGRAGVSLPTKQLLAFQLAHAQAQDAVHCPLECEVLADELTQALGLSTAPLAVHSRAEDRAMYLQRPDYGRRLNEASRQTLQQAAESGQRFDLAVVIVDGLSALAVQQNSAPFLTALYDAFGRDKNEWQLAPLTLVEQGRVAIGDEVGALLNADAVLVMVGERPGLSSPDSLGLYMTWGPEVGLKDDRRNCISNVRPAGLAYEEAARRLLLLLTEARERKLSGVKLKDRSEDSVLEGSSGSTRNFLVAD